MKILYTFLLLVIPLSAFGEEILRVKGGVATTMCIGIRPSPVLAAEYETRNKHTGIGIEVSAHAPYVRDVGQLLVLQVSAIPKVYYKNAYFGCKIGYLGTLINQEGMDVDDELGIGAVLGVDFDNFFVETQTNWADLDLETWREFIPKVEKRSRLTNWQIMIGKRFEF